MPRGKRTVYGIFCSDCKARVGTQRLHKQDKKGVGWKEHLKDVKKYCSKCKKRTVIKGKEERHSK